MLETFFDHILEPLDISDTEINQYPPLVLAYIGDTVYEVFIRTLIVSRVKAPVHKLHRLSTGYVKAKAQSDAVHKIMDQLLPKEQDIVRRGRNAKSGTIPKNADVAEYKYATGFEALIGYLYLKKEYTRLMEILKMSVEESENRD